MAEYRLKAALIVFWTLGGSRNKAVNTTLASYHLFSLYGELVSKLLPFYTSTRVSGHLMN